MHLQKATKDEKTRKREEKQEQWAELYYRTLLYILLRIEPHLSVQISLRTTDVLSRVCGSHMCPFLKSCPIDKPSSKRASFIHLGFFIPMAGERREGGCFSGCSFIHSFFYRLPSVE